MVELCSLFADAAFQLDNYLIGNGNDMSAVQEISEIIDESRIRNSKDLVTNSVPPSFYLSLWDAMEESASKPARYKYRDGTKKRIMY